MARTRRVAAIWLPGLPMQCAARDDATIRQQPVAITDGAAVVARNRRAAEAGVAVGMRVAEAVTHAPDLLLVPDDPQGVQAVWDAVLAHLDHLGPVVEDAGCGEALVDLSGVNGGERLLVRRTLTALGTLLQLTGRAAVADGPAVAAIAARRAARMSEVTVIPRGHSPAFLAPQPMTVLPLPAAMQEELALVGVHTVGGFAGLRPSEVQRRFGRLGLAALALAIGQDDRPLVPHPREWRETLPYSFDPPVEDLVPVLFVVKSLLDSHASTLRRAGAIAHGLRLTLTFEHSASLVIEQRWGAATIPGHAELDALRLALDARATEMVADMPAPRIEGVEVTLLDCTPDAGMQLPLTGGATILRRQAVGRLLTRLRAFLGPDGVVEAVPTADHLPEAGWMTRPYDAMRVGTPVPDEPPPLDAALLPTIPGFTVCRPPEPLTLTWHAGVPTTLRIGEAEWAVATALGPYTAEGEWWSDRAYTRAYWLILTTDQALHLIAEDRRTEQWARYGVFD